MKRYRVIHATKYVCKSPVSVCHNQAWLKPRSTPHQQVDQHSLTISPQPSTLTSRDDTFENHVTHFSFNDGYKELVVKSESEVRLSPPDWAAQPSAPWEVARDQLREQPATHLSAYEFSFESRHVRPSETLASYAAQDFRPGRTVRESLIDLTSRIHQEFEYDPRATTVSTPVEHVFKQKKGVCQDFAHLQIAMLRSLGIPARYVSGYVRTGNVADRPDMIGADASHAWLAAWCPMAGWIDADPTNDTLTNSDHVTVAWGREYSDVPPLRGVFIGGGAHTMNVEVSVEPL